VRGMVCKENGFSLIAHQQAKRSLPIQCNRACTKGRV
jgi:hypothetical protein